VGTAEFVQVQDQFMMQVEIVLEYNAFSKTNHAQCEIGDRK
jgi:hypothetical protein